MSENRRLAAIMAVDVVGYSRLMGKDEAGTARAVREDRDAVSPVVASLGGRVVKTMGDGVLLEFPSVVAAVECAVAIQKMMVARHADAPQDKRIVYRIGVSLGDVLVEGDDILGDGVNIAARLEGICKPGGVVISGSAFDHVRDKMDAKFDDLGEKALKNIARPVRAYQLQMTQLTAADASAASSTRIRVAAFGALSRWKPPLAGWVLLLLFVAASTTWLRHWSTVETPAAVEPLALASKHSIAVLPFANLSAEKDQDYFADGLSDDLTTKLSQIKDLFVIARSSMYAYRDKPVTPQEVAQKLGVRYVVVGSVQKSGDRLRINANLIEASHARQIWAEHFDENISNIFEVQDKVLNKIISALTVQLTDVEQRNIARAPTNNLEAYDYYLRAENEGSMNDDVRAQVRAMTFFGKAIELDPGFANAQAGYALMAAQVLRYSLEFEMPPAVARKRAYDAAGRALDVDPNNSRAYVALAFLQLNDGRHSDAVLSARRAVSLGPNDPEAFAYLGMISGLCGRADGGSRGNRAGAAPQSIPPAAPAATGPHRLLQCATIRPRD